MAFGDLTTLADVKAWLTTGQQAFPSTDDALLTRLITAASGLIQTWLKRQLSSQDWMETRDGPPGGYPGPYEVKFQFANFPVTAVYSVVVANYTIPQIPLFPPAPPGQAIITPYTTLAGWGFSATQLFIRGYSVPPQAQCVSIVYTAGYAQIPSDVAQACIELVVRKYRERGRIAERARAIGAGETASYEGPAFSMRDLGSDIQFLLMQYRAVAPVTGFATPAPTQTDPAIVGAAL
jgi:hypothetical protein